ncbi:hypothetical protein AAG906_036946 [Vitis piasezkii]
MTGHRSAHRPPFQSQFLGTPYQMIQHDRYRPVAPIRPAGTTYLHPPPQPVYATQAPQRPPMQFHHQYRAPPPPRSGLVDLGAGVATDPLPTHDTRAVPPPLRGSSPLPADVPFFGIAAREEVQREDDEILRQLRTTQARISIWSLLASSSTHRDALVRALGQIRVDTTTTPEGLIHMLTADRATCRRCHHSLDNGSTLNTVRAYDGTQRTVMGTLSTHVMIGPVSYSIVFQVLRIQSSFNLLLGRPWIHEAGAIPSSLHQKVKYYHLNRAMLHINHGENDLHLTGFAFDEVQSYRLRRWGSEHTPRIEGTVRIPETVEIQDIQQALGQMHLDTGTTETPGAMIVAPPSPDRASVVSSMQPHAGPILLSICSKFLYSRLMRMTLFLIQSLMSFLDFTSIEGASDSMDPPLSSDTTFGFVTRFDDISDDNNDMSISKYLTYQPWEIRIGSSLSPNERSRLIDPGHTWMYLHGHMRTCRDDKVMVCVDFRDLNKVGSKDDFPSHTLISLVDSTCRHRCCPSWMAFPDVEVYVDDMIVKSSDKTDHLATLQRFFERIRFEIESQEVHLWGGFGKFLGHIVSERGIEIDPRKSISNMALGCMLAQLDDLGKEHAIYYLSKRMLEYECKYIMIERLCLALVWATRRLRHYMTEYSVLLKSVKGSIVADHLASLPISDDRSVDDDFPDEQIVSMTSITGWRLYFDGAANQSGFGIGILTRDEKLKPYHAYLDLLIDGFDVLRYIHLPRAENQFADALATLASMIVIPTGVTIRSLLIETRRSPDGLLLLCLDRTSADRVMREVHAGVCGPHMGGHMLARKIMRAGYFWLTMETDCCQFVQRCQECQMHGDLIHVPPSELHALTSPWPFSIWGVDIIGKISPKSSSGHEYILVAIDYFTKWVEAASYARLTAVRVAKFIRSHIICRYEVPHELISDRGVHFRGEVDTLIQDYGIQHQRSSAYRPQTNGLSYHESHQPRKFQRGDLVLKDGNQFIEPINVDQLKKFYA